MDHHDARKAVHDADTDDVSGRADRLVELTAMLPNRSFAVSGPIAQSLFDDVKATWIYGFFAATIVTSAAFCLQQIAGLVRLRSDDPSIPESTGSLEQAAALAHELGIIDMGRRTRLIALHDRAQTYLAGSLQRDTAAARDHMLIAARITDEAGQLIDDARGALQCGVELLHG